MRQVSPGKPGVLPASPVGMLVVAPLSRKTSQDMLLLRRTLDQHNPGKSSQSWMFKHKKQVV